MPLKFADDDGEPFATDTVKYLYSAATLGDEAEESRITVPVDIGGQRTEAVVDTAADWSVCHPEVATAIDIDPEAALHEIKYDIRGFKIRGSLYLMNLSFLAQQGSSLSLVATVFVPGPDEQDRELAARVLPKSFLGLMGCLERIRFAVDPFSETFCFGGYSG